MATGGSVFWTAEHKGRIRYGVAGCNSKVGHLEPRRGSKETYLVVVSSVIGLGALRSRSGLEHQGAGARGLEKVLGTGYLPF